MKRSFLISLLTAISLLGIAGSAFADQVDVTFTGVNGSNQGGYYTSPYYGFITEPNGSKFNVDLYCNDFTHEIVTGESWLAVVSNFQDLSQVRFPGVTSTQTEQRYGEMAWLVEQIIKHPTQAGDINFALWAIADPAVTQQPGFTPNSALWLATAESKTYSAAMFKNIEILTPISPTPNSAQEMLIQTATPEPASLALFGTGMLALGGLVRRLRK